MGFFFMVYLNPQKIAFPDPVRYHPAGGLIAAGGDLSPARLELAYRLGIFPWYNPGEEILWWSPDPRFVLFPDEVRISKSMKKILKSDTFSFSVDRNFEDVMRNCGTTPRRDQDGTWISEELIQSFLKLHEKGIAHSFEVWQDNSLVGGFYGLSVGRVFCGESMFSKVSNASKAGFINFVLNEGQQFDLIDCQIHSDHLESLGAREIPKLEFLEILNK